MASSAEVCRVDSVPSEGPEVLPGGSETGDQEGVGKVGSRLLK